MKAKLAALWLTLGVSSGCHQANAEASAMAPAQVSATPPAGMCGHTGQPDCPLQGWMKSTLQAYQRNHEYERLAKALSDLSSHAPEGYERWKELSARGVLAAQAKDDPTLRQVCKDCHNTHRARYRSERRASALW